MTTWHRDFLDGYEVCDLALPGVDPAPGEPADVELVATLVRRMPANRSRAAALYVHGWNDYFFQTHLADNLADLGYDFYALDLRRFGRSLRRGHLRGFITDLDDYALELDAAADLIAEDHDELVLIGHSTGGLINLAGFIVALIFCIMGTMAASRHEFYKYPINARFIK